MITLNGLRRVAGKEGVPQAVIEKDYVLSVALKAVSATGLAKHLVFKGGTAIKALCIPRTKVWGFSCVAVNLFFLFMYVS